MKKHLRGEVNSLNESHYFKGISLCSDAQMIYLVYEKINHASNNNNNNNSKTKLIRRDKENIPIEKRW